VTRPRRGGDTQGSLKGEGRAVLRSRGKGEGDSSSRAGGYEITKNSLWREKTLWLSTAEKTDRVAGGEELTDDPPKRGKVVLADPRKKASCSGKKEKGKKSSARAETGADLRKKDGKARAWIQGATKKFFP